MLGVIPTLLICAVIVSCTIVTPMTRIKENPAMYQALSSDYKILVQQGRICNGMSKEAVFLAWGMPDRRPMVGQIGNSGFEKWVYTRTRPVMVERPYLGGFYGPGYWGPYWGGGWDTAYVPEVCATVTFEEGKVTSWERMGSRQSALASPYQP